MCAETTKEEHSKNKQMEFRGYAGDSRLPPLFPGIQEQAYLINKLEGLERVAMHLFISYNFSR